MQINANAAEAMPVAAVVEIQCAEYIYAIFFFFLLFVQIGHMIFHENDAKG